MVPSEHRPTRFAYSRFDENIGKKISFRLVDKATDTDLLWRWMNLPHVATQWKMTGEKDTIERYIDANFNDPHQDAYLGYVNDTPVSYWEAYWACDDILGKYYDASEKDRGWHMLVGEKSFFGRGIAPAIITSFTRFLFLDDSKTEKVVGEPSVEARSLLRYADACCFEEQCEIELPEKRAKLMFCYRDRFIEEFGL